MFPFSVNNFITFQKIINTRGIYIFFHLGFLTRTFTIHRTAVEGEDISLNFSLPLPPAPQTLRH